ncbi:hypothetical protein D2E76_15855 [Mycobacteroides abscessus]|uniref:Uncharacterized protein n=1 Tax=Mycobacteroides abscessus TaxID=36809 RepID=A0ABD7HLZ0_9MYCO|nr:hypothetical protein [Mycobacteroides abscessus]RIT36734.1 hypothetical protein D2E76_15855 [Mycobacteroides abscessus]
MTDASSYSFKWTLGFGKRMRQLRSQLGNPPYDIVEAAGGPPALEQADIEQPPLSDASTYMVSEDTLRQYAQAYTRLGARPGSEARDLCTGDAKQWPAPSTWVDESFVMALGEAGFAASDPELLEMRGRQVDQAARTASNGQNTFVFGALSNGELVNADHLKRFGRGAAPGNIAREEARAAVDLFYQHIAIVAGRHPAISVAADHFSGNAIARHWHSEDSVKRNVFGRLDPIDGIRTLTAARQRAIALKAAEERLDAVAPMIVLINALTDQLNAQSDTTAQSTLTALDTWRRYKEMPGKWSELLMGLPGETWRELPDVRSMVMATGKVLSRWEYVREGFPLELTYQLGADKQIEWAPKDVASPPGLSRQAGDLWLIGEPSGTYSAGLALIRDMGQPALHFRAEDEELVTLDPPPRYTALHWCPSGILDNIVLVHRAVPSQVQWRAVQIY